MSQPEEAAQLGRLESLHPVETDRVVVPAIWGIVIGALLTPLGVLLAIAEISGPHPSRGLYSGLPIIPFVVLVASIRRLIQSRTLRGQSYEVHENGFIHRTPQGDVAVPWSDVRFVDTSGREKYSGWQHALALDFNAKIRCSPGRVFKLTSMTADAQAFCTEVRHHVAQWRASQAAQPGQP